MGDIPYMILSALGAILNIAPFCWQIEHLNSGPICLGFWVILLNINNFVNAVIWRNDAINRAPAWCDFSQKVSIGGGLGLLAANFCIVRFLARVVSPKAKVLTASDQSRRAVFDYSICLGIPIFVMATHIIYQPIRFGISKTVGCQFGFVITWPTLILWMIWSPILASMAAAYGVYVVYRLLRHRHNFGRLLATSDSALTTSRFIRLALLSGTYALFTLPLSIYQFILQLQVGGDYIPYDWNAIHRGYYKGVVYYAPFVEKASLTNYVAIISAILVLVFFGFSNESLTFYYRLFNFLTGRRRAAQQVTEVTTIGHRAPSEGALDGLEDGLAECSYRHSATMPDVSTGRKYTGPFAEATDDDKTKGMQISVTRYETVA